MVYCDNCYSSAPLVDQLAEDKVFFAGSINECAKGFPDSLKKSNHPEVVIYLKQ